MRKNRQSRRIQGLWNIFAVWVIIISPITESSFDIPESSQDICPGEGFFPDPRSCTKFYRCVETFHFFYAYEFECPAKTVFDPVIQVCNHPYALHPRNRCFIGNLMNLMKYRAKEIIQVINDTTIHRFVKSDSGEYVR